MSTYIDFVGECQKNLQTPFQLPQEYVTLVVNRLKEVFGSKTDEFLLHLKARNCVISGSFLLWCLGHPNIQFQDIDLDVFAPKFEVSTHESWLLYSEFVSFLRKLHDKSTQVSYEEYEHTRDLGFAGLEAFQIKTQHPQDTNGLRVQLIYVKGKTPKEYVHQNFDFDCVRFWYDGTNFMVYNPECFTTNFVPVSTVFDTVHRGTLHPQQIISTRKRVDKYKSRGFVMDDEWNTVLVNL